jgi:hypothetical protein
MDRTGWPRRAARPTIWLRERCGSGLVMQERRVRLLAGAAVSFGVAVALGVQVVTELVAINREYPLAGWEWWADPITYVVLALPLLPALLGVWLLRRARRG